MSGDEDSADEWETSSEAEAGENEVGWEDDVGEEDISDDDSDRLAESQEDSEETGDDDIDDALLPGAYSVEENVPESTELRTYLDLITNSASSRTEVASALNKAASILEHEETAYIDTVDDPQADERTGYSIAKLCQMVADNDILLDLVLNRFAVSQDLSVRAAALRFLAAAGVTQQQPIVEPLLEERRVSNLLEMIFEPEASQHRLFATCVLALCMMDDHVVSNIVIPKDAANVLMQRLLSLVQAPMPASGESRTSSLPVASGAPVIPADSRAERKRSADAAQAANDASRMKRRKADTADVAEADDEPAEAIQPVAAGLRNEVLSASELASREMRALIMCVGMMGQFQECVSAILNGGLTIVHALLQSRDQSLLADLLRMLCSFLMHNKFTTSFLEQHGLEALLALPRLEFISGGVGVCLFGIASHNPDMENICRMSPELHQSLIAYALWILTVKSEWAKMQGALFFTRALLYRPLLAEFDKQDGLSELLDVLRQTLRNVPDSTRHVSIPTTVALRQYLRAHLVLTAESLRKKSKSSQPKSAQKLLRTASQFNRQIVLDSETLRSSVEFLETNPHLAQMLSRSRWAPVDAFLRLNGQQLLFALVEVARTWRFLDLAAHVFEVLQVVTYLPFSHYHVSMVEVADQQTGMSILMNSAEGGLHNEMSLMLAAMEVLTNIIACPLAAPADQELDSGSEGRRWVLESIRANNGIKVLLTLLQSKQPPLADALRAKSAQSLLGLYKSDEQLRQLLEQLQIAHQLSDLLQQGPVQRENTAEHAKFAQAATELVALTTKASAPAVKTETLDHILRKIEKSRIVAKSHLTYSKVELLKLIAHHLLTQGLPGAAVAVIKEADLDVSSDEWLAPLTHAVSDGLHSTTAAQMTNSQTSLASAAPASIAATPAHNAAGALPPLSLTDQSNAAVAVVTSPVRPTVLFADADRPPLLSVLRTPRMESTGEDNAAQTPALPPAPSVSKPPRTAIKHKLTPTAPVALSATPVSTRMVRFYNSQQQHQMSTGALLTPMTGSKTYTAHRSPNIGSRTPPQVMRASSPGSRRRQGHVTAVPQPPVTLNTIVTQYLKEQHRHCANPISLLPPLSLFEQHTCPRAHHYNYAPTNIAARLGAREIVRHGGYKGRAAFDRYLFSRFRPRQSIKDESHSGFLSCAYYHSPLHAEESLLVGCRTGEVKIFSLFNAEQRAVFQAHDGDVQHLKFCQSFTWLTSCGEDELKLWNATSWSCAMTLQNMLSGELDCHERRLVCTDINGTGFVFDIPTTTPVLTLPATVPQPHDCPAAVFDNSGTLILHDARLFDSRNARMICKFDKLADHVVSSVFHPFRNEVLIDHNVWDVGMRKLVTTIPELQNCVMCFNRGGNVLYGVQTQEDSEQGTDVFFRTVSAVDYTPISTMYLERNIVDLDVDLYDFSVFTLETGAQMEAYWRVYDIGRSKPVEDSDSETSSGDEDDSGDSDDVDMMMFGGPHGDDEDDMDDIFEEDE
eukprot:TRINITY_DN9235_c0_g1_i1.p1 TRINITY_DN9235_c0_g1~~TRINITY_DN9235_c0_g1_i1.p1  ORF type:complete len:1487 (-),score=388.25 TRINITY_DN9235_c0_g1_i1:126-4586(-)